MYIAFTGLSTLQQACRKFIEHGHSYILLGFLENPAKEEKWLNCRAAQLYR
jgi:hypothetical protein